MHAMGTINCDAKKTILKLLDGNIIHEISSSIACVKVVLSKQSDKVDKNTLFYMFNLLFMPKPQF